MWQRPHSKTFDVSTKGGEKEEGHHAISVRTMSHTRLSTHGAAWVCRSVLNRLRSDCVIKRADAFTWRAVAAVEQGGLPRVWIYCVRMYRDVCAAVYRERRKWGSPTPTY